MTQRRTHDSWWKHGVLYEVYLRSFADDDGDGIGDIAGLRSRVPYLAELGVDAVWVTPWYRSPMVDGGYDVADYREIDPVFGTLDDVDALVAELHAHGMRIVVDFVPNHTSDQHVWFQAALADRHAPERELYFFRDGRGSGGELPPNDWVSAFGGSAWTRVVEPDGQPGQWYLHLFAAGQPDLNWEHERVLAEFDDIIRFWFDRGVDGLRLDAIPAMRKRSGLPDAGHGPDAAFDSTTWVDNPHWDLDDVHEILRRWRSIADSYGAGERMLIAEAVVRSPERLARYLRGDELHAAFNFDFLRAGWEPGALRAAIDGTLHALGDVGAPASWVLSSHDETRHLTRFGRRDTRPQAMAFDTADTVSDLARGQRRARAAVLLQLALPGMACLYQGDELGLDEVTDLPDEVLQDPTWLHSGNTSKGRDGCRVPLPWSGSRPPFGFAVAETAPWLPQPEGWRALTVEAQTGDPASMLTHYRRALGARQRLVAEAGDAFAWNESQPEVLDFARGDRWRCVVNLSPHPIPLPAGEVLIGSAPIDGTIPPDGAVWLGPAPA